jgi:membrane protease YdiL (CAAX protease family)
MSADAAPLSSSAFIAGLNAREKTLWRVLVTLLTGLVGGFIIGLLAGLVVLIVAGATTGAFSGDARQIAAHVAALIGTNGGSLASALILMLLALATNGPWAATFVVVAALIAGRRPLSYLTAAPRFRWTMLLAGLCLSALLVGPVVAIAQLTDPHATPPPLLSLAKDLPSRVGYVALSVLLLIPAAGAEEVVFRGWLLRQSAALTRNPFYLMALNGILFAAAHGEFAPDPFLTRALMGAGFVYMTLRLGGVEFSTGAHAANNILIVLFIQPLSLKTTPSSGLTFDSLLHDAFLFVSYILITEITVRWTPLRRWTGMDQAKAPASKCLF